MKTKLILTLVGALALSALATPVFAQFTVNSAPPRKRPDAPKLKNIHGLVADMKGTPIPNAQVLIRNRKTKTTRTSSTDDKGMYGVFGLAADADYEVTAQFKGQSSEMKLVSSYLDREDNLLNFQLNVSGITAVPENSSALSDNLAQFDTFDLVRLHASLDLPIGIQAPIPAVLLLHGYGENRKVWDALKQQLLTRGWAVMTLDLRGFGESTLRNQLPITASPDWRTSAHEFPQDLDPALDWLKSHPRLDSHKIAVIGYDVGANLALIASGRFPEVRTVIAVKPNLNESLALAGSAQDFTPRSALVFVPDDAEGTAIKASVAAPVRVQTLAVSGGTNQWFLNQQVLDATFQWLKDTY